VGKTNLYAYPKLISRWVKKEKRKLLWHFIWHSSSPYEDNTINHVSLTVIYLSFSIPEFRVNILNDISCKEIMYSFKENTYIADYYANWYIKAIHT